MLWLLRHADAARGEPDEARPLTPRGIEEARTAGTAIARLGIHIDTCLSSPKRRALETAELACEPLGVEVVTEPALARSGYDPERLAAGQGEVMLVGHNPAISLALTNMTGARVDMRKGGIAGIKQGELVVLMRPAELRAIAGATEVSA
ncbi:MAG TPA: phosphoglycerate mutase family protein [Solirubrobacteraceae bacterium]|jgi:phosphohistidine phosphatase|nr:phosphoglycerate mutase family protein [Solirubrobacteraceae bacterium]